MKFVYPAVFHRNDDNTYEGYFPDLTGCTFEGDNLNEAIFEATEAGREWIRIELTEEDPDLPSISDPETLELKEGDELRSIAMNVRFFEGWDE